MAVRWRFTQDDRLQWRWSRIEGDEEQDAAASFDTPARCMIDAVRVTVNAHRERAEALARAGEISSAADTANERDAAESKES